MSGLTYTQRLADTIRQFGGATAYQASAELLRLEARVAELEAQEAVVPPKREPASVGVVNEKARLNVQHGHSWRGRWNEGFEMVAQVAEAYYRQGWRACETFNGIGGQS